MNTATSKNCPKLEVQEQTPRDNINEVLWEHSEQLLPAKIVTQEHPKVLYLKVARICLLIWYTYIGVLFLSYELLFYPSMGRHMPVQNVGPLGKKFRNLLDVLITSSRQTLESKALKSVFFSAKMD